MDDMSVPTPKQPKSPRTPKGPKAESAAAATPAKGATGKKALTETDSHFLIECLRHTTSNVIVDLDSVAGTLGYSNPRSVGNKLAMMKKTYGLTINTTGSGSPAGKAVAGKPTPNKVTKALVSPRKRTKMEMEEANTVHEAKNFLDLIKKVKAAEDASAGEEESDIEEPVKKAGNRAARASSKITQAEKQAKIKARDSSRKQKEIVGQAGASGKMDTDEDEAELTGTQKYGIMKMAEIVRNDRENAEKGQTSASDAEED